MTVTLQFLFFSACSALYGGRELVNSTWPMVPSSSCQPPPPSQTLLTTTTTTTTTNTTNITTNTWNVLYVVLRLCNGVELNVQYPVFRCSLCSQAHQPLEAAFISSKIEFSEVTTPIQRQIFPFESCWKMLVRGSFSLRISCVSLRLSHCTFLTCLPSHRESRSARISMFQNPKIGSLC